MDSNEPANARYCKYCDGKSTVISTRLLINGSIVRTRQCESCGCRWLTLERYQKSLRNPKDASQTSREKGGE